MKIQLTIIGMMACAAYLAAQEPPKVTFRTAIGMSPLENTSRQPVVGAPYAATITNENVQTLADGNRITQTSSGMTARDSQGRTRQDAPLPVIGNLAAANAPHLVFINDPVAQKTYTLNLTEKTADIFSVANGGASAFRIEGGGGAGGNVVFFKQKLADEGQVAGAVASDQVEMLDQMKTDAEAHSGPGIVTTRSMAVLDKAKAEKLDAAAQVSTEDLGSQTMEGVLVTGTRTTRTIPAGEIGNERPINIVIEVWTSPELQTVVMSKRTDPRMGEQTFRLTNIVRTEPDASLFAVPADFKVLDAPQRVIYKSRQ
jgi:hypothetical protein